MQNMQEKIRGIVKNYFIFKHMNQGSQVIVSFAVVTHKSQLTA